MYGGLTHTGGFADAQGLSSMVPQSVPQSYSTSLPDHLYGDQAKDFFDLTDKEVTQIRIGQSASSTFDEGHYKLVTFDNL